jgi:1-acyl-sn-glycerol-3-phosphate acyltransferase
MIGRALRVIARLILKLGGWTAVGETPAADRAVIIAAPHTSNWDAVWALTYKVAKGLDIRFFAKHTLFWFPLGQILRALGAIPLDRDHPGGAVRQAVDAFARQDTFYFGLAPEGTRARAPHWKSGFYRIATDADVPIVLGFLDFGNRRLGMGPTIRLTGDRDADMARIAEFYAGVTGRRPENATPVRMTADAPR